MGTAKGDDHMTRDHRLLHGECTARAFALIRIAGGCVGVTKEVVYP